jgi:hypothetical protein
MKTLKQIIYATLIIGTLAATLLSGCNQPKSNLPSQQLYTAVSVSPSIEVGHDALKNMWQGLTGEEKKELTYMTKISALAPLNSTEDKLVQTMDDMLDGNLDNKELLKFGAFITPSSSSGSLCTNTYVESDSFSVKADTHMADFSKIVDFFERHMPALGYKLQKEPTMRYEPLVSSPK